MVRSDPVFLQSVPASQAELEYSFFTPLIVRPVPLIYSVIVPAYLGASTIADCLRSVEKALSGKEAEIIVVESPGDGTASIVREGFPHVRLIESPHRLTAGAARNLGASSARGRILFFVDQDCTVPTDWIDRLSAHFTDTRVGAAGGSIGIRNPGNLSGCAVYFLEFLTHFPNRRRASRNSNFLIACNCAYRRDVFEAEMFPDRTLAEDILFTDNVRRLGYDVVYESKVTVQHWNRSGWDEFFSYNRKMGKAAAGYHTRLQMPLMRPFLRFPRLAMISPAAILPKILINLIGAPVGYLLRYLLLLPACFFGNMVWAFHFQKELRRLKSPNP